MISLQEIGASIRGAGRLLFGDAGGMEAFDDTPERFWRSFWAAAYAAPLAAMLLFAVQSGAPPKSWGRYFVVSSIVYVMAWFLWPLIMVSVAGWLGRGERYYRYIQAYNWAQFIGLAFKLGVLVMVQAMFKGQGGALMLFVVTIVIVYYYWFIARTALEVSGWVAAALVASDIGLAVAIDFATVSMARG
ncbi:MAG: hypothetical protein ACTSUD_02720 [Alphaproteobacteria bacterium]